MTDKQLTPEAIDLLNRLAQTQPTNTVMGLNITPQAKRALEMRVNLWGAMWFAIPKIALTILALAMIGLNLPRLVTNVYELFVDRHGGFTLDNFALTEPIFYGYCLMRLAFVASGTWILVFTLLQKKKAAN